MKKIALSTKEETPIRWGRWKLDEKNLSLFTNYDNDNKRYSLPLVLCNDAKATLGWITSIHEKEWTTNFDIGDVVEALNDLLNLKTYFDRNGNECINASIIYTRNIVQKRIRFSKIKTIKKGG
jgi:hypothetical protein